MPYKFVNGLTGDDSNNGDSWATAYRTLDKAWTRPQIDTYTPIPPIIVGPGIYTLELPAAARQLVSNEWHTQLLVYGVGGGPVIKALSPATAHTLYNAAYGQTRFVNATIHAGVLALAPSYGGVANFRFSNCGIADNAIFLNGDVTPSLRFFFSHCRFQGAVPSLRSPISQTFLNFNGFTTNLESTTDSEVRNCTGNHSYTPSGHMQGLFLYPQAVQYDSFGPSFRNPEELIEADMDSGLVSYERGKYPGDQAWAMLDGVRNERFTEWVADPTITATFHLSNCDTHTKATPAAAELTSAAGEIGRLLSPVMYYPLGVTLTQIVLQGQEFEVGESRQVLDSTPETSARTVEFRFSDSPFTQLAESPSWITVERGVEVGPYTGKYLQYRVTFALNAVA